MKITSITPTAAAGVGNMSENGITGIVEIVGDAFLDDEAVIGDCIKPDDHHVKFRTIDNNWIAPLEGDYLEYTDTIIRVKVPTVGYKNNSDDLYSDNEINDAVACTGEVRVCRKGFLGINCGCFVTSDTVVYVPFAARNKVKTNDLGCRESIRYILQDLDDAGGYAWRFDPSFTAIGGATDAFKRAMTMWRCATRVNFKIDEVNPPATGDGLCTVKMANLDVGTRGATNFTSFGSCFGTDVEYPIRIEMTFNSTMNWHTSTDMPDLNWNVSSPTDTIEGDLESTVLHELGHAHLLLHTCNTPNVMVRPGPNDYRRMLTSDDEDGGNHLSMLGNNTNGCQDSMNLISLTDCDITPVIDLGGMEISIEIYPNPTSNSLTLELNSGIGNHSAIIELVNTYGRQLKLRKINKHENIFKLDISQFPVGIYYARLIIDYKTSYVIGKINKI